MSAIWREGGPARVFPFGEDRSFLRAHEEVLLGLLGLDADALADAAPAELAARSGGRIDEARADEIVRTARLARLPGLGTWAARLLAEAGLDPDAARTRPAAELAARVNARLGYPVWNDESIARLAALQARWRAQA